MVLYNILVVVATFITIIIAYYKWSFQYWKRRKVPFLTPTIPFGTSIKPFNMKIQVGCRLQTQYNIMKRKGWKYGGFFLMSSPTYLVVDLDHVKNVLAKDFQYFTDRGFYSNEKSDPLSAHLFNLEGSKWRNMRTKLTPTFTSGKMKMMFQTLVDCVPNLLQKVDSDLNGPIDIKEILGCFTTDIIGSCAFGLDCNTFKEENSPFREFGKKAFDFKPVEMFKLIFVRVFPTLAKKFELAITPKDVTDFFLSLVKDTVNYRKNNGINRNDFMQLLINTKTNSEDALTIEQIAAQSFVFFLAGFETSSTIMAFTLYELARRPKIQEKVREEVATVLKRHGKMTYEAIQEMKYLEQVINEILRMYPPLPFLNRKCVKDYKVPGEDVVIEKGTRVVISVLGIHYDEEIYPEPEKFDPDRFTEENKNARHSYAHIPFGEGPRICIGLRFGFMQSKVGLSALLNQYTFSVNNKTKEPLKMKPTSLILAAEGEIWLNAQKL